MQQQMTSESNPATPRTPEPTLNMQLEARPVSPNMDHTFPKVLCPATSDIHIQSPSNGGAEPAAMSPTRRLSPSVTTSRQEHKCGPRASEGVDQLQNGNNSVKISRSFLQEVKMDDSPLDKVQLSNICPQPWCSDSLHFGETESISTLKLSEQLSPSSPNCHHV